MLLNRISKNSVDNYNEVVSRFISQLEIEKEMNIEAIPFYVSCLLGEK